MAAEREQGEQGENSVEDLDVNEDEAAEVKGGRARAGDPCDGGE